jgi:hypothetical protein
LERDLRLSLAAIPKKRIDAEKILNEMLPTTALA